MEATELTIRSDGDQIERDNWELLALHIHHYEVVWRLLVAPLRSSGSIYLRDGIDEVFEEFAMCHYTTYVNLARAMDHDRRVEFISHEVEKVYPGLGDNLEGVITKVWQADPWVGGAAAFPSPGQMSRICIGIERSEGRVHFAGEHRSRWTYWMQGALQSGLRAAKEVNEAQ